MMQDMVKPRDDEHAVIFSSDSEGPEDAEERAAAAFVERVNQTERGNALGPRIRDTDHQARVRVPQLSPQGVPQVHRDLRGHPVYERVQVWELRSARKEDG